MRSKLDVMTIHCHVVRDLQTGHRVGYVHFQKPYATPASASASNIGRTPTVRAGQLVSDAFLVDSHQLLPVSSRSAGVS